MTAPSFSSRRFNGSIACRTTKPDRPVLNTNTPSISRRRFLAKSLTAGSAYLVAPTAFGQTTPINEVDNHPSLKVAAETPTVRILLREAGDQALDTSRSRTL